jgi:plastocyanin
MIRTVTEVPGMERRPDMDCVKIANFDAGPSARFSRTPDHDSGRAHKEVAMNRNHLMIVLTVLLTLVPMTSPAHALVQQINVANFAFSPPTATITLGDTLRWVWVNGTHTATSGDPTTCTPDGLFSGPLDISHPTFQYVFTQTGTFDYFCTFHCMFGMTGQITVQPTLGAVPETKRSGMDGPTIYASPNPFFARATLELRLPRAEPARVEIYDITGRSISVLTDRGLDAGTHPLVWDGRIDGGEDAPGGIYYARATTPTETVTARLILVR